MNYRRARLLTLLLAVSIFGSSLTACGNDSSFVQAGDGSPSENVSIVETVRQEETKNEETQKEVSVSDIDATFKSYYNTGYTTIDKESALKLIRIAMEDVKELFYSIEAPNLKYDENLEIITGDENFYPEWMDEYFFLARAMSESSLRIDVLTDAANVAPENDPRGIMQICPISTKETLSKTYFRDVFGVNIDFSDMEIFPSAEDVKNVNVSKKAEKKVLETIYNNMFLSICYSVYNAKCLNPVNHPDYYKKYKDFDDARRLGVIVEYHEGHNFFIEELQKGKLREASYAKVDANGNHYLKTYIENIEKYQNQFRNEFENINQNQPE